MLLTAYLCKKIFTGTQWLANHAVITQNRVIEKVVPVDEIDSTANRIDLGDNLLAPAYIDLQIYGANKKLLSVYPAADAFQDLHDYCLAGGAPLFQPTVATNTLDVFYRCIDAARQYRQLGGKGMIGLHLEGPWLNPDKCGAHNKEWIHEPGYKEAEELLDYGKGVITMITLAPEVCSEEVIRLILEHNVVIAAGHSNATYEQAFRAFHRGIRAVTHLYNAMSPLQHREPGLVGATLLHPQVHGSIIPDGHHVDYAALMIAKQLMNERLYVITDAVTETAVGRYRHQLAGDKYVCNGILSGSALTMHQAMNNLVQHAGIPLAEALRMCSLYPARVMRMETQYGQIAPGFAAQFVVLNQQFTLTNVISE